MISIGLDIGSVAAKGIMLDSSRQYSVMIPTGWSPRDAGRQLINSLLDSSGYNEVEVDNITVTGYGRVAIQQYASSVTEIRCHARGVAEICPGVSTIIDIGGQDSKVIHIDESGRVLDFAMNDKCAAGTGKFLQVMANALEIDVSELGEAEDLNTKVSINSMCTVFAESEIVGLFARGTPKGGIIAGLHQSVGKRVGSMAKRLGVKEQVAFTGGVAQNQGIRRALEQELGCRIIVPEVCQFTGALGAALIGRE